MIRLKDWFVVNRKRVQNFCDNFDESVKPNRIRNWINMNNNNNNYIIDDNLRQLFDYWDTDMSGYLSRDEMRELCARFGISGEEADAIFADLDRDRDGKVSFEDLRTGFDDYEKGLIVSSHKQTNSTSESYSSLKKALESENISEKFIKNQFNAINNNVSDTING